jgi:hypothetical protein
MPNIKISAAADAGTLLASDMLPLARSGDTNAYHATMAEISTFTTASVASGAYGNVGRNLLHNGLMNVAQRGAGPFTTLTTYTLDRWVSGGSLDAVSFRQFAANDADRAGIGDEACQMFLSNTFTGNAGAGAYSEIQQRIEGVARLSGKTVTLSFWADASAALKLGINATQSFGTGGSPSGSVSLTTGIAVTLSGTWTRYTATIALPSIAGKTLGTNGDSFTMIRIAYSSGANTNQFFGNIGVQSGSVNLWGVQLEIGSVATPLEKLDPRLDLSNCQRFYQTGQLLASGYAIAGIGAISTWVFPVVMRASPTLTASGNANANLSSVTLNALVGNAGAMAMFINSSVIATGGWTINQSFTASADL